MSEEIVRTKSAFILRNYPDDDARINPKKYSKALSFSPDIIPLYGKNADQSTLANTTAWSGFTGMPIVGGHVNNVYIRGHGSGGPYVASLWAVPGELILWPHVWQNEKPIAFGPAVIPGGDKEGHYVSDGPLQFRPPCTTGITYSLVASVSKHVPGNEHKTPTFDLKNFGVDDFISFLSDDKSFTFYNVVVADPTLKHVSANTRLRMIGKLPVPVSFHLSWHNGTPVPEGLEVSLVDDRGEITIPRTQFSSFGGSMFLLDPSYDGILMLNIFASGGDTLFEPYSGLSLQVLTSGTIPVGSRLPEDSFRPRHHPSLQLLGSLNVIFEPQSTRNLRFANPAATQSRESKVQPEVSKAQSVEEAMDSLVKVDSNSRKACGPIPVTKPAATGWWTRALVTDTNSFPHPGPVGYSPDIQPVGTDPNVKDIMTTLQNPALDYSTVNNVELVGNQNNYIYVRGHSTLAGIDVQSRLFAIGANAVNIPSQYLTQSLVGKVPGARRNNVVNDYSISAANADQFYVFDKPFVIENPPQDSTNHYCFIVEFRQKRKCCPVFPGWPSDQWDDYATLGDFAVYVVSNPFMCWRNINWEPCQPWGKTCWVWPCSINLNIPRCSFYCSLWTIIVECDNQKIPSGCEWKLTCEDQEIFPGGICFDSQSIGPSSPAFAGCHFTGARPGYSAKLNLSVTWCDGGDPKIPPPSIKWRLALAEVLTAPLHLANDAPPGSEGWPFYVTSKYPYLSSGPNPSPFSNSLTVGSNKWPASYSGAPQFTIGQVSFTGKRQ